MNESIERQEGWAKPAGKFRYHYFQRRSAASTVSACGLELDPGTDLDNEERWRGPADCPDCWRALGRKIPPLRAAALGGANPPLLPGLEDTENAHDGDQE